MELYEFKIGELHPVSEESRRGKSGVCDRTGGIAEKAVHAAACHDHPSGNEFHFMRIQLLQPYATNTVILFCQCPEYPVYISKDSFFGFRLSHTLDQDIHDLSADPIHGIGGPWPGMAAHCAESKRPVRSLYKRYTPLFLFPDDFRSR